MLIDKFRNRIPDALWLRMMRQRDRRKYYRRQIVRFFRNPRLAIAYARYRTAVGDANWPLVKQRVIELAGIARRAGDAYVMEEMAHAMNRLGCYQQGAALLQEALARSRSRASNVWQGENLAGKSVLVNLRDAAGSGLGVSFRSALNLPKLAAVAKAVTVIVEPRLTEIFRRSFPQITVLNSANDAGASDYIATPQEIIPGFAPDDGDAPDPEFRPLVPDQVKAAELRRKYLAAHGENKRLIGICWYSSHHGKDLPPLQEWRDFIRRTDATFVSLQYGNVEDDIGTFGADRVIVDDTINQLKDMDGFAAQVAALDGVITIVNTLVQVGGALGVPTVVLRDDWFRRNLPYLSDRVPWYPYLRVAGRNRREWGPVLDDAHTKLSELWAQRAAQGRSDSR